MRHSRVFFGGRGDSIWLFFLYPIACFNRRCSFELEKGTPGSVLTVSAGSASISMLDGSRVDDIARHSWSADLELLTHEFPRGFVMKFVPALEDQVLKSFGNSETQIELRRLWS